MRGNNDSPTNNSPQDEVNADHNHFNNAAYTIIDGKDFLLVDILGTWSRETMMQYLRDVKRHAKPLSGRRWAMMVLLDEWNMSTQDSVPLTRELSQWCYNHGITHCALVYPHNALKTYQLSKMMRSEAQGYKTRFMGTISEACDWLNKVGYDIRGEQCEQLKIYRRKAP